MSKYGNRKTVLDGVEFDSKREAKRWAELKLLERAGEIKSLERQRTFELIPAIRNETGRVIQRAITYRADFTYEKGGKTVVEDAKGFRTDVYKIKRKLMLWRYGIEVNEV